MQNEIGATGGPAVPNAGGGGTVRNRNNSIKESAKMVREIQHRPVLAAKIFNNIFMEETFESLKNQQITYRDKFFLKTFSK